MKKKLLSLALVFVMALTLLPTAAFAEDGEDLDALPSQSEIIETEEKTETRTAPETAPLAAPANTTSTGNPDLDNPGIDPQVDPSCTHTTTKWEFVDTDNCKEVCTNASCGATVKTQAHDPEWITTATTHTQVCKNCKTEKVSATPHTYDQVGDTCVCGAAKPATTDPTTPTTPTTGCGHTREKVEQGEPTCVKPGYLLAQGTSAWYCATCGTYYTTETGMETVSVTKKAATGKHTIPTGHTFASTDVSDKAHTYLCDVCGQAVSDDHVYESGKCKVCGFPQPSTPITPSPYRYIDITSAYVNSYSISVTWASDLSSGTLFDIYVGNSLCASGVAPSKSSGYFTYTVDFSRYLGDGYYDVAVYLYSDHSIRDSARVYNRYYDHDYDYWYDHNYPNSTPSTNSSGIPYASQVRSRYSASEAIRILRNSNHSSLQYDLLNSNSASNSFSDLEQAVKRVNNVSVQVDVDRNDVPSAIRNIRIDGAAFNASSTNSTVRLVVDAPAQGRYTGYGYAFSMSLTGVGNDSSLDVPVKITMPVPSDINTSSVRILHYHNAGAPEIIEPKVSGRTMSFTVTGFSDFVVTDRRVDPYYYYYTPGAIPVSARRNIMEEHLAVVLPILASMPPSGYVFDDVPPTYWAATEIAWARDGGMMSGYYDGTFRPYAATTRQELWMVLARLAGARPADMWAAREWAISAGISDGRNPHSPLSRQQMISMLYRYAQYLGVDVSAQASLRGYGDSAAISGYARNAMAWAIDQGILAGDFDGLLHPQDIATRADFAVYLYRFIY